LKVPFFSSLLIIGALAACQGLPLLKGNQPDPQPGDVLFSDDFSSEATGWGTWNADGSAVAYHSGGLRVLVGQPNLSFWSTPGKTYDDAVIEVDAQKMIICMVLSSAAISTRAYSANQQGNTPS